MERYANNSEQTNDQIKPMKLFGRERSIHAVLGGGKAANLVLWRKPKVTLAALIGVTLVWLLFEVVDYNLVTLFCHGLITTMLVFFIYCTIADLFRWNMPNFPQIILDESTLHGVASVLYTRLNKLVSKLLDIATEKDLTSFISVLGMLWFVSIIGNYVSSLNLLYIGYLLMNAIPVLYEKYEDHVDCLVGKLCCELMALYVKFDSSILRRIPRGPTREKKRR